MVLVGGMLMACHSNLDLTNVDTSAQIEMGVAVPVGSLRLKVGDILGDIPGLFVDSASGGAFTMRFEYPDSRDYHKIDMRDHVSEKDLQLNVYDALMAKGLINADGSVIGTGKGNDISATIHFDLPIKLKGVNAELGKERLDSALIKSARFSSVLNRTDLPVEWEWIDQVVLDLGPNVCREAGSTKVIYTKGDQGGYGQKFNTDVDHFSLSLMKNKDLSIEKNTIFDYATNVTDSVTFGVDFKITIPKEAGKITLQPSAEFAYHMEVEFVDYSAIWGFFAPDKDMISKKVEVDLDTVLGESNIFGTVCTPFTDPEIKVAVTTQIAGAMVLNGNYIYVLSQEGDSTFALFNGQRSLEFPMNPWLHPDPKKSPIGASITDTVRFSKADSEGRIDRLFGNLPKRLGYDFYVNINSDKSPQARITDNTHVDINAICELPMKFREGLFIDYRDTLRDVNLSAVNIDSLVRESSIIDSLHAGEVTIYLTAYSKVPMTVKAVFRYLDKNNQPIKDPTDPSKLFNPFLEDTLRINPPRFEKNALNQWVPVEDGKSVMTAYMSKEKLSVVPDIRKITYQVIIDNAALNYAFDANPGLPEAPVTADQTIELNIGLTAQIDAVFNLGNKK